LRAEVGVATERRTSGERRHLDRRTPGESVDVTRLEHENVCRQIDELLRSVRRLEQELGRQRNCIEAVGRDLANILGLVKKSA
jgi:hypothetical protein